MRRLILAVFLLALSSAPALASAPWVHTGWEFRMPFSAVATQIEGTDTFTDFGMLVVLDGATHAHVFANAKADGSDLLFTTQDGAAILERELVSYDDVSQTAEVWVRVPGLSKTENTFFLYYDNPAASLDPSPTAAWGTEYRAIYHFEDAPGGGVLNDSSWRSSNITLTPAANWTNSDVESAAIGQGWTFNGSTHWLGTKSISTADSSYAISAWLKHTTLSTDFFFHAQPGFWHLAKYSGTDEDPLEPPPPTGNNAAYAASGQTALRWHPQPVPLAEYHHFLWEFDAVDDTVKFYYDGTPRAIWGNFPPAPPHYTGRLINPTNSDNVGVVGPMFQSVVADYHDGGADEFRIREGVMGPDRILTEFRNQDDNAAFFAFDAVEIRGTTDAPLASLETQLRLRIYPNPSAGRSSVQFTLPQKGPVRIAVYDLAGRHVTTLVDENMPAGRWVSDWNGLGPNSEPVANGVYFLRLETPYGVKSSKLTLVH